MNKLVDAELAAENYEKAELVLGKSAKMSALFDLWEYSSFVAPLQVAMVKENADECVDLLRKLLESVTEPWNMKDSPLFYRIQTSENSGNESQMLKLLVSEMEKNEEYEVLKDHDGYRELVAEYRQKILQ